LDIIIHPWNAASARRNDGPFEGGPGAGRRKSSLRLDRGSTRPDPMLAKLGAADGASGAEREEWEHAGIHQCPDQDLDRDSDQEREDRAEQGSHGKRPYGPGWETMHGVTAR